jgi:hypothetical protein
LLLPSIPLGGSALQPIRRVGACGFRSHKRNQHLIRLNLIAFKDIRWKNCTTLVLRQTLIVGSKL